MQRFPSSHEIGIAVCESDYYSLVKTTQSSLLLSSNESIPTYTYIMCFILDGTTFPKISP